MVEEIVDNGVSTVGPPTDDEELGEEVRAVLSDGSQSDRWDSSEFSAMNWSNQWEGDT